MFCAVNGCEKRTTSYHGADEKISYHIFPKDPVVRQQWIEFCDRGPSWEPHPGSIICSDHFPSNFAFNLNKRTIIPFRSIPSIKWYRSIEGVMLKKIVVNVSTLASLLVSPLGNKVLHSKSNGNNSLPKLRINPRKRNLENAYHEINNSKLNVKAKRAKRVYKKQHKTTQTIRRSKKIITFEDILKILRLKFKMSVDDLNILESIMKENNYIRNMNYTEIYTNQTNMRKFFFSLYYFSSKACAYILHNFETILTPISLIKSMNQSNEGEPGLTKESLIEIQNRANALDSSIVAILMVGEMSLRRCIEMYNNKVEGYLDVGTGLTGDHLPEAKEVLVFFVSAINSNLNIPVAYFFVDSINAERRADLVKLCLSKLFLRKIRIIALSCKGSVLDLEMAENLGCRFDERIVKFEHPNMSSPVILLLDLCYSVKLIINAFRLNKIWLDKDGKKLEWRYLEELRKLNDNMYTNDNICTNLGHYHNIKMAKMKLSLDSHPYTSSTIDAMHYCRKDLKQASFMNSKPTEQLLKLINNILMLFSFKDFDISCMDENAIFEVIDQTIDYISGLKTENGKLLLRSRHKTGFLGLLAYFEGLKHMITRVHKRYYYNHLTHLPFFKLNLRPLDLFFHKVTIDCETDYPTARQFKYAYKNILFAALKCSKYDVLYDPTVLNHISAVARINKTSVYTCDKDICFSVLDDKCNKKIIKVIPLLNNVFEYKDQVFVYAVNVVARYLIKKIVCNECTEALMLRSNNIMYASKGMLKICKISESVLKTESDRKEILKAKIMRQLLGVKLFDDLGNHEFGGFPTVNHATDLIKAVIEEYVAIRFMK